MCDKGKKKQSKRKIPCTQLDDGGKRLASEYVDGVEPEPLAGGPVTGSRKQSIRCSEKRGGYEEEEDGEEKAGEGEQARDGRGEKEMVEEDNGKPMEDVKEEEGDDWEAVGYKSIWCNRLVGCWISKSLCKI